jgi:hypothetical protein
MGMVVEAAAKKAWGEASLAAFWIRADSPGRAGPIRLRFSPAWERRQ